MKMILPLTPPTFRKQPKPQGVALVIVLTMLVLLSAVLIAFMASATNERAASQASNSGAATRQIADSTLNLVMAQIRDATTQPAENVTWASQPGAIRTFSGTVSTTKNQIKASGGPSGAYYYDYSAGSEDYVYKLYSATQLRPKSSDYATSDLPDEVKVIENWDPTAPEEDYVDLNQPFLSARLDLDDTGNTVEPRYPIIDPRAKFDKAGKEITTGAPGIVEGFDAKITEDKTLKMVGDDGSVSSEKVPYLPMPVKWLYVLKDGTIGDAKLGTATNPIVGRTAFWTDDETCKLNINTASEGTFWDTPVVSVEQESGQIVNDSGSITSSNKSLSLAASQPARFEYQRYPGHPATTCLSPVFGWLWGVTPTTSLLPQEPLYKAFKEAIYQITAFTPNGPGTSKGGTGNTDAPSTPPRLNVETKHIYANVDEIMFTSERLKAGTDKSLPNAKVTPSALEKMRFFLSATSRAPELNLYSRPRVTIWPIHDSPDLRTSFDELFAFTSTIAKDPSGDEKRDKRYNLTRFDAKSDVADYTPQNKKMYEYLQALTAKPVPGFGDNFKSKYGDDRDQILTEIFDYIRTVNLVDTGTASRSTKTFLPYTPKFYTFPPGVVEDYSRKARSMDWSGQVTPLKIGDTMGLGRFPTISEAALVFLRVGPNDGPGSKQSKFQGVLLLEMATPMAGYPSIRPTYFTKIIATKQMQVTVGTGGAQDADLCRDKLINICNISNHELNQGRGFMPIIGAVAALQYFKEHKGPTDPTAYVDPRTDPNRENSFAVTGTDRAGVKKFTNADPSSVNYKRFQTVTVYPYVTKEFAILPADTAFTFTECDLDVEIWSGESPEDKYRSGPSKGADRAVLVQTVHLSFPAGPKNIQLPAQNGQLSFANRLDGTIEGHNSDWIRPGTDFVRSIELTCGSTIVAQQGDMRLAMARKDVPKEFFTPRDTAAAYGGTSRVIHGLNGPHGDKVDGHTGDGYLAMNGQNNNKAPMIPKVPQASGVRRSDNGPGDWDRGLSKHMDGAMGNKVDEGNVRFAYGEGTPAYKLPYFHGRNIEETGQTFFTPNRQLPSAVMFGSLPTGVKANPPKPWQTLLFRPDRETSKTHPGASLPEDHLLLDLFQLPVVEPYAISEPFSTAGKVNMNFVIAPFGYAKGGSGKVGSSQMNRSYLRRDTALRGVLKSTWMLAVPSGFASAAHVENPTTLMATSTTNQLRHPINLDKTIEEMETRQNDQNESIASRSMNLFRSASEICTVDLFPQDLTMTASWGGFWDNYAQTGDNMRERPYAHIFPRLTTKSNVYTVHMRCQAIKKTPSSPPNKFDPARDQVVGEYRGSAIVERFIDPNDPNLKDYNETTDKVDAFYRYRVVATKQFSPR